MVLRTEPICFDEPDEPEAAGPRLLALDSIDEDPDQPRTEFDAQALEELASTIRMRGVLQPVSVRPHPQATGRWMLNFGSRRFRASRIAQREVIPAFVDASFDTYAQVIENEQRQALQPMELALFVKERKALGETQVEIGRLIGKSQAYVSMAQSLIDAPDWLMDLYRSGKCRGLTELYHLRRLHEAAPAKVAALCESKATVTRADLQPLIARPIARPSSSAKSTDGLRSADRMGDAAAAIRSPERSPSTDRSGLVLVALCNSARVELVTSEVPPTPGHVFVIDRTTGVRASVVATTVLLQGFDAAASR